MDVQTDGRTIDNEQSEKFNGQEFSANQWIKEIRTTDNWRPEKFS